MGQKVNPNGLRIGISRDWSSRWYAPKENLAKYLKQDNDIRAYLDKVLADAVVSHIDIERVKGGIKVEAHVQFVGKILGRDEGKYIEQVKKGLFEVVNGHFTKKQLENLKENQFTKVDLHLFAVESVNLDATLVAKDIAKQLEGRSTARVVQKKAITKVMNAGAKGIKTMVKGRVGGAEIARSEQYREGVLSLHTLKADIDYALAEALTTYGILGCKVWISRPENYKDLEKQNRQSQDRRNFRNRNQRDGRRAPRRDNGANKAAKKGE